MHLVFDTFIAHKAGSIERFFKSDLRETNGCGKECTPAYISRVRERYGGRWICGLCAEAVKDETCRAKTDISTDEALKQHTKFCQQFRSSTPPRNPTEELISAIKQLLRRGLDSPRKKKCSFFPSEGSSFSIESRRI
ncbi:hypothetical protein OIU79_011730 [Salix purpurea]|uniref:Uncharacterized protein n=1 Tax=Salix purpurea TaxID=77065 RepID=A0A9Q0Q1F7_SALPP|nr:hypothetical protein OIU79_011730 [Salix purpurea]